MRFEDMAAIVTGAASGIGAATAQRIASEGAGVALVDLDTTGLERTADEINGRTLVMPTDVADEAAVSDAVERAAAELGRPSVLVTAAGIFQEPDIKKPHEVSLEDFRRVLDVNLVGTFLAAKHTLPHLVEGGGAIVTIASTAALLGHGFGSGYTASKGGVAAFTRLLAVRYGRSGVRANCVCPGGTDTPMTGGIMTGESDSPLGVYAQPEEIAAVIAFAASPDASHLTGQTIAVDGGATVA